MSRNDKCWLQCQANSVPQIGTMCHNVLADPSQNNFLQQQQQQSQQQQTQPQQQQFQRQQTFNQPIQRTQYAGYPVNQQGPYYPAPPCQPDPFSNVQQLPNTTPAANPFQASYRTAYDLSPASNPQPNCGTLPPGVLEQIRACMAPSAPIFILPNNPIPVVQTQGQSSHCPAMRCSYETSPPPPPPPACNYPPSCFPYPVPMPFFNSFNFPSACPEKNCGCSPRRTSEPCKPLTCYVDECQEHRCEYTTDDTICAKKNCPSSISLQALASQLLSVQGVISCAATRLVLRKVPGSNITNTMEETMERAKKTINVLTQDQLLAETRNAQQVNALINLHMTACPPQNIVPMLTTIQLKVNLLKSQVECLINRRLCENQSVGAEGSTCLDAMSLALKSDEELRTLLATLRQRECNERVNYNFAPYHSQRAIAECRLRNIESKINQVEAEIERRRYAPIPSFRCQDPCVSGGAWHAYPGTLPCLGFFGRDTVGQPQCCESPDPFQIDVRSPRRLNLKPHVGSPETTYSRPPPLMRETVPCPGTQADQRETDDLDERKDAGRDRMDCECMCECKSSDDDSADEAKKKLRVEPDEADHDERRMKFGTEGIDKNVNNRIKLEKKKTVDFVRQREMDMDVSPEKDSAVWINDRKIKIEKLEEFDDNVFNKNVKEEPLNKKIISLHEPANSKTHREESTRMITNVEYDSASFDVCFEGLQPREDESSDIQKEILNKKFYSDAMLATGEHLSGPDYEKIFGKCIEDFFIRSSLKNVENMSDQKEQTGREILQGSLQFEMLNDNSAIPGSSDFNEHKEIAEKKIEGIKPAENTEIHYKNSIESTLNPFPTKSRESGESNNDESQENFLSGALSVIGNHVASFGSIIDKITALRSHLIPGSSHKLFGSSSASTSKAVTDSCPEVLGNSKQEKREPIKWKYMTFSRLNNSAGSTSSKTAEQKGKNNNEKHFISSNTDEITIPQIKRVIVQDKTNEKTYILMRTPRNDRQKKLNESFRAQRTLLIRSRLKNSQSTLEEQPIPFTVVTLPNRRQNSIVLLSGPSRSNQSNRRNPLHALSSEKFWSLSRINGSKEDDETEINAARTDNVSSNVVSKAKSSLSRAEKTIKVKSFTKSMENELHARTSEGMPLNFAYSKQIIAEEWNINVHNYSTL